MNVLAVCLGVNAGTGGMERFNRRLADALVALYPQPVKTWRLLALRDPREAEQLAATGEVVGYGRRRGAFLRGFSAALFQTKPDVILFGHALFSPLLLLARVLCPRARRLLVVHGIEVWGEPWRSVSAVEKILVHGLADRIVSVSQFTASRMATQYGLSPERFELLPNTSDVHPEGPRPRRPETGRPILLSIARMNRQDREKGIGEVIRALPAIARRFPDVQYEVIGDGDAKWEYQRLAEELGVSRKVWFLGRVSDRDRDAALARASAFLLPSRKEGFGIVFLEAWNYDLPVIGAIQDAASEVIVDGKTGLLVDGTNPAEIARGVLRLLEDPELAARLGAEGYRTLRDRYSPEQFRENLNRILNSVWRHAQGGEVLRGDSTVGPRRSDTELVARDG